jgi:single-strand DNA-binding protein
MRRTVMGRQDRQFTIEGNLTRDPELKFSDRSGDAICKVGIADSDRKRNDDGTWEDTKSHFFDVTCWGKLGEHVAESFSKGDRVIVTGHFDYNSWENDEGEKRSKVEFTARAVGASVKWVEITGMRKSEGTNGEGPKAQDDF